MFSQQARTRAVLGALGIPLWGVRAVSPQSVVVVPILGKHESDCEHIQDQMIHAKSNAKSNTIVNKSSIKTLDSIKIQSPKNTRFVFMIIGRISALRHLDFLTNPMLFVEVQSAPEYHPLPVLTCHCTAHG